ncbi:MAG TPA: aromatic ring-hydroxylating dioxygenase subunit alpha [Candidatus Krumholzibacteria bacterium]|nr:aromatic ring-hydroxylating dioxygenase subunit alpha [Candidatus Krumholzibacteria bacterium]
MTQDGHRFIAHVRDHWYPVCRTRDLRARPLSVTLFSMPLVVFRTAAGAPAALLDRCPHRNVPLSLGTVHGERLRCVYHGWEFDGGGQCCAVPGLVGDVRGHERGVEAFAAREAQGFVWVYARANTTPSVDPFTFPHVGQPGYTSAADVLEVRGSLHATAENALDVPHTAFLHGGWFRNQTRPRREIDVIVRRAADRVEAEYVGESRPPGIVARLLAPRGGHVIHVDRFILPSVAQVEYRLGDSHLCISAALTPVEDYVTRLFVVFSFRLPFPGALVKPVLRPFALRVFGQDAAMLARQTDTIHRFGEERYKFTEIDVLGAEIFDLLRRAERGGEPGTPGERRLRLLV